MSVSYINGPASKPYGLPNLVALTVGHEARASWQKYGGGFATMRAERNLEAGWVQFIVAERPDKGMAREVFFTMNEKEAAALVRLLTDKKFPVADRVY